MMSQRMVSVISIDDMFEDLSHQPESFNVVHTVNEYTGQGAAPSSATHATNDWWPIFGADTAMSNDQGQGPIVASFEEDCASYEVHRMHPDLLVPHVPAGSLRPNLYPPSACHPPERTDVSMYIGYTHIQMPYMPEQTATSVSFAATEQTPRSPIQEFAICTVYDTGDIDTHIFRCHHPKCKEKTFGRWYDFKRHYNGAHAAAPTVHWCQAQGCPRSEVADGRRFKRKDKLADHVEKTHGPEP